MPPIAPPAPPFIEARRYSNDNNFPIFRIVIHCTAGTEPGVKGAARGTANYFANTMKPASAQYVRDSLEAFQCVGDSKVAYHAPPNPNSIGYEICCSLSNQGKGHWTREDHRDALLGAAKDCAKLALAYNVPIRKIGPVKMRLKKKGFCGHIDVSRAWAQTNHWDPGPFFPWKWFIRQVQREAELLMVPDSVPEEPEPVKLTLRERARGESNNIFDQVRALLRIRSNKIGNKKRRRRIRQVIKSIPRR